MDDKAGFKEQGKGKLYFENYIKTCMITVMNH